MSEPNAKEPRWILYGANGYTGELCAREAVRRGMRPVLAGRRREPVEALANELGLEAQVFGLDDGAVLREKLEGAAAVLHCAGPFSRTGPPMLKACAQAQTHYLDITGEITIFEYVHRHESLWRDRGVVAMPGVGFDVVPTDCMAAALKRALPDATHLRLAFKPRNGKLSPGTAKTVLEGLGYGCYVRQDGELVRVPQGSRSAVIPYESGERFSLAIAWGDVSTAYYSTGIPNIEVYMAGSPAQARAMRALGAAAPALKWRPLRSGIQWLIGKAVSGPSEEQRTSDDTELYGDVTNAVGERKAMVMTTPNGYALTVDAALHATARVVRGEVEPGPKTPSLAFGPEFVEGLQGVRAKMV